MSKKKTFTTTFTEAQIKKLREKAEAKSLPINTYIVIELKL